MEKEKTVAPAKNQTDAIEDTNWKPVKNHMTENEIFRIIKFLEETRQPFHLLGIGETDLSWNIIISLMKSHLQRQPVAISALIAESGAGYGTAHRKISKLIEEGKILRAARSKNSRSFRLKPSPKLYSDFLVYAEAIKGLMARTVGFRSGEDVDEFYFGGGNFVRDIVLPPPLLRRFDTTGKDLRFLLNDDNYFAAMRNMWADYRNSLSSRKNFSLRALPDLRNELASSLRMIDPTYDVVAINMPWIGEFAEADLLQPLDKFIKRDNLRPLDFHPAAWSTGTWGDQQFGVPIYVSVETLAIRKDLFREHEIQTPRTFDEVIEAGCKLHRPENEEFGIAWNAARGMPIASSFMIWLGCCGRPVINLPRAQRYHQWANLSSDQLRPNVDCEEARWVLDYMHRLVGISPPDILNMDWNGRIAAFLKGNVGMTYCWSMRAARFDNDITSRVKHRVSLAPQPKGPGGLSGNPVGGFLLSIPKNLPEERTRMAFEAIAWMTSPEAMKKHVTNGVPIAPRFSIAADPEAVSSSPIVRFVDKLAQSGMLCTWQRPPIPEYRSMESILGYYIHEAIAGHMTDDAALSEAQNKIDQAMRDSGRY